MLAFLATYSIGTFLQALIYTDSAAKSGLFFGFLFGYLFLCIYLLFCKIKYGSEFALLVVVVDEQKADEQIETDTAEQQMKTGTVKQIWQQFSEIFTILETHLDLWNKISHKDLSEL